MIDHLSPIRDISMHPLLMLVASVSEDGSMILTDISHSVKSFITGIKDVN
jgi:hypothetical protein